MKNNRKLISATAVLAIVTLAAPAFAWLDGWSGARINTDSGVETALSLTAEQQKSIDAIQGKYQPQLQELRQQLNSKLDELSAARSDDATTVGRLNELESELNNLERGYWSKRDQANQEMAPITGAGSAAWFACNYRGCDHDNGRHRMMQDDSKMSSRMTDGKSACCR